MSKSNLFVLCVLSLSLNKVYGLSEDDKKAIQAFTTPIVEECSKEFAVSSDEIKSATETKSIDNIKPCFVGCLLKKSEVIDENGFYDAEKGLGKVTELIKDPADRAKFEKIGKLCASVNEKPVNDEKAGCERAKLLLSCGLENNAELPF